VFQGSLLNEDREMDYFRVFCSVFTAVFTLIDVTVRKEATVSN